MPFLNMQKIGILGGVGWPSTVDYYRGLATGAGQFWAARGHQSPLPIPQITIESVTQAQTRSLRGTPGDDPSWEAFEAIFRAALLRLEVAGCDFAIMASNTPHMRLAGIRRGVTMPILSIFDAASAATARSGANRALVLGTAVTMQSDGYTQALAAHGISTHARQSDDDIAIMQAMIDHDFYAGANSQAREKLLAYCERLSTPGDAILLACTELPLAFPEEIDSPVFEAEGFLFVNPSAAHIAAALDRALPQSAA